MEITRNGSQPSAKGSADWFTGNVRVDPLFQAPDPARVRGAYVTFEPGARTAWHTHPLGQTLIVTAGCGRVQRWGGPIEEIRPGDVVWFPPSEKHWHGVAPTTAVTHIAIQEALNGNVVEVEIAPMPGHLTHLAGEMVHPRGRIVVDLHFAEGQVRGTVTLPAGLHGTFCYAGKTVNLQPGTQSIAL